jgi:hypothetical protein
MDRLPRLLVLRFCGIWWQRDVRDPEFAVFRLRFVVVDGLKGPFLPVLTSSSTVNISEDILVGGFVSQVWLGSQLPS